MPANHFNGLQILKLIHEQGSVSRAQLAEKTEASPFLVSKTCDQLLKAGFITEAGQGDSTGGRRPTLLSLRRDFGRLIGIHFGTVNVRIAITDFTGNLIDYVKDESHADRGPEVAMRHLTELIDRMLQKTGLHHSDINGIGIGVSGVLERATGVALYWPKLPLWVNVPVRPLLEARYKTLVEMEDTSRTQALAEYRLGGASSSQHFVYITVGAGIGAALFLNGRLYTGVAGFAGEFGHITVSENGPLCSCGNRGCVETMVSASAMIRNAERGVSAGLSNVLVQMRQESTRGLSVEMLAQAARQGDRFVLRILSEAGSYLGQSIVGLINLLNPELIVIGGGVASAVGDLLLPEVERVVRDRAMLQDLKYVNIRISKLHERDWALGAALLTAEKALAQSYQKWTEPKKRAAR